MEVVECIYQLIHDSSDVLLSGKLDLFKRGEIDKLHYQPAGSFAKINIESLILDDIRVLQPLDRQEIGLQSRKILLLELE
jgi:hypothetical protein